MLNIFVEGIPGSGKSTLLNELQRKLQTYHFYYEGDLSPLELAWCSYMTQDQYQQALVDWPQFKENIIANTKCEEHHIVVAYTRIHTENHEFYRYMEKYEIYGGRKSIGEFSNIIAERFNNLNKTGYIFECAFFQNIIDELILFAQYNDVQILAFFRSLLDKIRDDFLLIHLIVEDIEESIKQIKEERINEHGEEVWYQAMISYLSQSPYGKNQNYTTFEHLITHFQRRVAIEKRIAIELLPGRYAEVRSKNYQIEDIIALVRMKY